MSFYIPHLCDEPSNKRILNSTHEKIVLNISKLIKELNLDNIHAQFYAYCYLLWNGYFSIGKKYFYNNVDIKDENNTIFLGRGCCRHNSKLLEEMFNLLDDLYSKDSKEKNRDLISRESGIRLFDSNLDSVIGVNVNVEKNDSKENYKKNEFDHSITLVKDKESLFLLDPTMLTECEILEKGRLYCINGEYNLNKKLLKKSCNYLYSSYKLKKNHTISREMILYEYYEALMICKNNLRLINDFYDDNHKNYEKIKQLII